MKYQKVLLCLALTGTLLFAGCSTNQNTKENISSSAETSTEENHSETETFENTEQTSDTSITGIISSVSDTELTLAVMPDNKQGGRPNEAPADGNADNPNEPPADGNAGNPNEPPTDGNADSPNEPPANGSAPNTTDVSTQSIPLTSSTVILDENGTETDSSSLTEGIMVTVSLDDAGNAVSIALFSPFGMPDGSASNAPDSYTAVTAYSEDAEISKEDFSSIGTDENAVLIDNGASVTLSDISLIRESSDSSGGDASSFYGIGAGILAINGTLNISDSTITTDAAGGAGIFAYGNGNIAVSNTTIATKQDTSGGIHVAGGGTITAQNLTVTTEGESSAAIRSDRGGGTMNISGGTYTSNGSGSPAVYCTADIRISDASLNATGSEAVCIEGLNSLTLTNCSLTGAMPENEQNDCIWTVILYQSMSGDSEIGNSTFSMTGGSLTSKNGGLFYTTNTESTFYLSNVKLIPSSSNEFLLKCTGNSNARGWGNAGANGADCKFTADNQTMEGTILWDSISTLDVSLTNNSVWSGTFTQDESNAPKTGNGYANLSIDASSFWIVTGDSTLSALSCAGKITDPDGNTVTIQGTDGNVYVEGTSAYTVTVTNYESAAN